MKGFGLLCLLLLTGIATFMYLGHFSKGSIITSNPEGTVSMQSINTMSLMWKIRKLKENNKNIGKSDRDDNKGDVELEDYRPIDPVPSSKASVRPGPIQHGTPLMPFIPRPSPPPTQPKHGG